MMEQVRLCAVCPMENFLGTSMNHIQGWTTVRDSYSCALEQGPLSQTNVLQTAPPPVPPSLKSDTESKGENRVDNSSTGESRGGMAGALLLSLPSWLQNADMLPGVFRL